MKRPRALRLPLGHLLFMTWLVGGASILTGVDPSVALCVTLVLTVLLFKLAYRPDSRGIPSGTAGASWRWTGSYLLKSRNMRRRTRPGPSPRLAVKLAMPIDPIRAFKKPRSEQSEKKKTEEQPFPLREAQRAGVLTLLALLASLLTGTALIRETLRLIVSMNYLNMFAIMDLCSVALLPLFIGLLFRCEIHSILTLISLSAAVQAILFRLAPSLPPWLFLALAEISLPGMPLGLMLFFGWMDRRFDAGEIETTTGKLLRGKRRRMWLRERAAGR